eukprot:COSAG04_NODE_909_length_9477_cov_22.580827_3_plen_126_part_00
MCRPTSRCLERDTEAELCSCAHRELSFRRSARGAAKSTHVIDLAAARPAPNRRCVRDVWHGALSSSAEKEKWMTEEKWVQEPHAAPIRCGQQADFHSEVGMREMVRKGALVRHFDSDKMAAGTGW